MRESGAQHAVTCDPAEAGQAATTFDDPISCVPLISSGEGDFELFTEGDDLYRSMLAAITEARTSVRLETYIFADDEIGRSFAEVLAEKAAAGVPVRVLIDSAGSLFWSSRRLERFLRQQRVQVTWYHRWSWRHPLRYNQRDHRKLLVVDDERAYLGGFNIHRENSQSAYGEGRWRDTHVRVGRELAGEAARQFDAVWAGQQDFMDARLENAHALVVSNIFRNCRRRFRCVYWDRLESAGAYVYLTTPYFVPDWRTQRRLARAARRGIDVRLLLPRKSDVPVVQWAAHAVYAGLLEAGVRLYEYLPRPLHAKTAAIDGEWSIVGSANLDYRSFGVNYEMTLIARDPALAQRLTEQFVRDLEESEEVVSERWARRPRSQRAYEWIGRAVQRWL